MSGKRVRYKTLQNYVSIFPYSYPAGIYEAVVVIVAVKAAEFRQTVLRDTAQSLRRNFLTRMRTRRCLGAYQSNAVWISQCNIRAETFGQRFENIRQFFRVKPAVFLNGTAYSVNDHLRFYRKIIESVRFVMLL